MVELPIELDRILDKRELTLRNQSVGQVKVQWKHLSPEDVTWEMESKMWEAYPFVFQNGANGT